MSQLPAGTSAARSLLNSIILKGEMAEAISFMPWLALWPFSAITERLFDHLINTRALDEATAIALAVVYVIDQRAFDKAFIDAKGLDTANLTPEQMELEIEKLEAAMEKFVRRGPVT